MHGDSSSNEAHSFKPNSFFLGLLQHAMQEKAPATLFSHPALGWIALHPQEKSWRHQVHNLREWCRRPANEFKLGAIPAQLDLSGFRPQRSEDLLWIAAFYAAQGSLISGTTVYDSLLLKHWPNLAHLPHTPDFLRLSALFSRRPHSLEEARQLLGVSLEEAATFYSAAHASGAIKLIYRPETPVKIEIEPEPAEVSARSLTLRSLWRRLIGKH